MDIEKEWSTHLEGDESRACACACACLQMWMVEESSGVVLGWRFKREIKLGFFRVERGRRLKRVVTLGFDEGGGGLKKRRWKRTKKCVVHCTRTH